MNLSPDFIAVAGFVILFVLMLLRVPVGMAMGLVGVTGYAMIAGSGPALKLVGQTSMRTVTDYTFGVIPMFMLMGAFVSVSGVSRELFRAANAMIGHLRGGLGMATVLACGGFAAICGSSVATAATFSTVAYPEMRRYGYPQSFSTGVIAAGGTLGAMLPPSTVLAVYAVLTQQDIGKLLMAGVLPGLLAMTMYVLTVGVIVAVAPKFLPRGEPRPWSERREALVGVWPSLALYVFVIGGLYGGFFTPTEAGGVGATVAGVARIPFVAGIDNYLPSFFGKIHPRWKTPHISILIQAGIAALILILAQIKAKPDEAYRALVDIATILYFVPFLYMYAAVIVLAWLFVQRICDCSS